MTSFASITTYGIAKNLIADNDKMPGFCAEALDEATTSHVQVNEIAAKLFVVFAHIGEAGLHVMTTALGEIKTFKTAGAAVEAVKLKNPDAHFEVKKLPATATSTKKERVARYKAKFAEYVKAIGNYGVLEMRIADLQPGSAELIEMLERKDAVALWSASVSATVADLKQLLLADGVDASTL